MLKPMQDFMTLNVWEEIAKTKIVMPGSYEKEKEKSTILEVIDVGPGYYENGNLIPMLFKKGDKVMVSGYGITDFEFNGKKVIVARARDVVLKVE